MPRKASVGCRHPTPPEEESVLFEDPATVCEENFTERALEDNYEGDDREALLADCGDDEEGNVADLEVSSWKIDGVK